ncbi:hypothetical protein [Aeromicrobium sp. Sec7.5]|uniref:hypothetical protein n=1 Tax=Aeromicrobium sp. Sec7.5 TaxID=3121276 RepID=UPI002FE4578E
MSPSPRRATPTLVALGVLLALVAALLVWQRPWASQDPSAAADDSDLDARLRSQLTSATAATDAAGWAAEFGPGGVGVGQASWEAREALGVDDATLTLLSVGAAPDRDDGTRSAVIRVSWTTTDDALLGPAEQVTATVAARVRSAAGTNEVDVLGFGPRDGGSASDPLPLWLAGEVVVSGSSDVPVVTVAAADGPGVPEAAALTAVGQAQVTALTGSSSRAAVIVPSRAQDAAALLGRAPDALGPVAGVTTSLPGVGSPVVVLNPGEFARMDPRGSQIVVTHELTHALTDVVGTTAPTWLVEGFADWVALHDDTAPLATSAGALLTQVAQSGPPDALPTDEDLAGPTSGAAYQGAWLSVVVLARDHGGDEAVLQVYRAVAGGAPVEQALAAVGTSVAELTAQWRDYLVYSASTVS